MIYNGEALDFLQTLPPDSVKLVITSPPCNVGKQFKSRAAVDHYLGTRTGTSTTSIAS